MRGRRFVPLMAAAFLLVPAMPASAHIQDLYIGSVYEREGNNEWDAVNGTITCTEGERFLVTAKVIDESYVGKGRDKGTCTGSPQGWWVDLTNESGTADIVSGAPCRRAKAHTKINGVPHDEQRTSRFC